MLEKPDLDDQKLIACLAAEYGFAGAEIAFLPLGADPNTAVYRVVTNDKTAYFLKLRRGGFSEAAVAVPKYLGGLGLKQIIPSLTTRSGQLWASLAPFKVIVYPFVEGQNGFEKSLSKAQWVEFGAALKKFHTAHIPSAITSDVHREEFSPKWRDTVKVFLERIKGEVFDEPIAAEMAVFLRLKEAETRALLTQAEQLAQRLRQQPPEFILCHADIHAWNLLITANGSFYMVDWDTLIFAPKERDLMFIGGGLGGNRYPPQEEAALFYKGYGHAQINSIALAYYRCERIIEDIAVYCEQIFLSNEGGEDRQQSLAHLKSSFLPDGPVATARQTAKALSAARSD